MWSRSVIKSNGKAAFKANYWKCVLVALLAGISTSTLTLNINEDRVFQLQQEIEELSYNLSPQLLFSILGVSSIVTMLVLCVNLLVLNPLLVGCNYFFIKNGEEQNAPLDYLSRGFGLKYWNVVFVIFMKDLFIFLWSLLFIIPGIIKSYSYRMVGYLLAENPEMDYKEALELSKNMMYGNKWRAFALDISFIGWYFLTIITLGLVGVLYTAPYIQATNAELYKALKPASNYPGNAPTQANQEQKYITFNAQ